MVGGSVEGQDVLANQVSLKSTPVGVVVGPDSTPTLSFTSGSEGRPKGVRGRHFSLAYYFPWMSETFKLTPNDRFTMLSGIAHDPIQRDIFTPLFLGAQLLVPAREDIQNEKLAEWMREYSATVTHLTPAMGQILVGGASAQFPALHHAFFVGDILIKRDCRSLQALAPNVNIVNMYGTTETQRAVSYYEIPSYSSQEGFLDTMKDVIPAGRGMVDVQMLVVNRFDPSRICAIGEVGEIYVRAGGLAEGYLSNEELNKKKFLTTGLLIRRSGSRRTRLKVRAATSPGDSSTSDPEIACTAVEIWADTLLLATLSVLDVLTIRSRSEGSASNSVRSIRTFLDILLSGRTSLWCEGTSSRSRLWSATSCQI